MRFRRDGDVPDEFWVALAQIDSDRNRRYDSETLDVSLERLLARRTWLGHLLQRYQVEVEFDERCLAALEVAHREQEEVRDVLARGIAPASPSVLSDAGRSEPVLDEAQTALVPAPRPGQDARDIPRRKLLRAGRRQDHRGTRGLRAPPPARSSESDACRGASQRFRSMVRGGRGVLQDTTEHRVVS